MAGLGERKVTFPDRFCTSAEFTATLLTHYPPLKDCGGYQLLRSRGSCRSKMLVLIDCPSDGYTPLYLFKSANIGQAVIYVRPLQKDIDLKNMLEKQAEQHSECMVSCIFCGHNLSFTNIQDHVDIFESMAQELEEAGPSFTCTPSASTSVGCTPSEDTRPLAVPFEEWKLEPDLKTAANMFRDAVLQRAPNKPKLMVTLDLESSETDRERDVMFLQAGQY
ncbi:uncharacterized protein LOC112136945 [Oryzias melastigma]|uniref:uncharacterized protein LOC112136945 n=1 Tax=Oryzias melastigma TaxID=30732 RepID=UPI000CF7C040|nr:uncharacterized protein LOC112136945 [Oryzias melastigma]XP_036067560.1 uncharacterized protein LOC112136945 [Oryzias melastigma]XP_036067561.1 uncharacterized protein LOC112136945 [Oryzias melastigma]